jgi:hypothetical protein
MPVIFEQQPCESAKAFAAFSVYLRLGAGRSAQAVGKQLGKSAALMRRWSAQHRWVDRAEAHAKYMAEVETAAQAALVREKSAQWGKRQQDVREEEWALHDECIRAGREALKRFYERGKGATLGDIARLLELASKLGRLASGMATDKTEVTGEDGGPIRVELEAALKKIYGAAPSPANEPAPVVEVEELPKTESGKQMAEMISTPHPMPSP